MGPYVTSNWSKWDKELGEHIKPNAIRIEDGKIQLPGRQLIDYFDWRTSQEKNPTMSCSISKASS